MESTLRGHPCPCLNLPKTSLDENPNFNSAAQRICEHGPGAHVTFAATVMGARATFENTGRVPVLRLRPADARYQRAINIAEFWNCIELPFSFGRFAYNLVGSGSAPASVIHALLEL